MHNYSDNGFFEGKDDDTLTEEANDILRKRAKELTDGGMSETDAWNQVWSELPDLIKPITKRYNERHKENE